MKEFVLVYMAATVAAAVAYAAYGHFGLSALVLFGTVGAIITGWVIGDEIKIRIDARLEARYRAKQKKQEQQAKQVW